MSPWIQAIVAIACSYAVALGTWPLLAYLPGKWIRWLSLVALPLIPLVGLVIAPAPTTYASRSARLSVAIIGSALGAISYLYWRRAKHRGFSDFARFLWIAMVNPQRLIFGHATKSPSTSRLQADWLRALAAAALILGALVIAAAIWQIEAVQDHWVLRYFLFIAVLIVVTTALGQLLWAFGRMTGYRGRPFVDQIWLSRTPADFWRRWNWLVHWVFYRYLYLPLGGRRRAIWATLMVFLVSGLGHELLVKASIGRATGHQMAFFLVCGLGVIASPKLALLARWGVSGEIIVRIATIVFLLAAATFMYATFSYFIPQLRAPDWLAW